MAAKAALVDWTVKPFGVRVFHHLFNEGTTSELLFFNRMPWQTTALVPHAMTYAS